MGRLQQTVSRPSERARHPGAVPGASRAVVDGVQGSGRLGSVGSSFMSFGKRFFCVVGFFRVLDSWFREKGRHAAASSFPIYMANKGKEKSTSPHAEGDGSFPMNINFVRNEER